MVPVQQHEISQLEFPTGPIPWTCTLDLRISHRFCMDATRGFGLFLMGLLNAPYRRLGRSDCPPEKLPEASEFRRKISFYGHVFRKKSHSSNKNLRLSLLIQEFSKGTAYDTSRNLGNPPLAVQFSQVSSLPSFPEPVILGVASWVMTS